MVVQPRVRQEFGQMQQESACGRQDRRREPHPANSLRTAKSAFLKKAHATIRSSRRCPELTNNS